MANYVQLIPAQTFISAPQTAESPEISAEKTQSYPTYKAFPSAGAALKYLLQVYQPQILGFGEFHNEYDLDFDSTSQRFAQEVIPVLKKSGFNDLVLEFIPDDPIADAELKYFKKEGKLSKEHTPNLIKWLGEFDRKGIRKIYEMANNLNLYGGNLSLPEVKAADERILKRDQAEIIAERVRNKSELLLKKGRKVATYTGLYHNDINPEKRDENISFGNSLSEKYNYLEIDLIVPEIFKAYSGEIREKSLYSSLTPKSGVLLIQESERKFIILFCPGR